jgi:uncharacterized protein (DUF362 family)
MKDFVAKTVGVYHFLFDSKPTGVPVMPPKPRAMNPWYKDNRALVAKVRAEGDLRTALTKVISLLGALPQAISRGDRVLVKPNFNSPDPFPASTDLEFLRVVVEMLLEIGAIVTVGESSGGMWRPSRNVFRKVGVYQLVRELGIELVAFEDKPADWVKVKVNGDYLSTVTMPRSAYEADKLVYLPCMKTHTLAMYSGALKLAFGFVHPGERRAFHLSHLQEKIAEVSLCWQPQLIIMDGRRAFVAGGPDKGRLAEPGLILASGDLIATDIEAMKVLIAHGAENRLPTDPWKLPQIVTALKHGLGVSKDGYTIVE